jgi:hypothetical protein
MLLSFYFLNAPVNEAVSRWTPETMPPNWHNYRLRWEIGHTLSALFALSGLTLVGWATLALRSPNGGMRGTDDKDKRMQIAILLYAGVTALDAVGPWEVLARIPDAEIRFVGKEIGPVPTEGDTLLLGVTHTIRETISPDLVLVPGRAATPGQMVDDEVLDWLRQAHRTTAWTASVCTGALILGAAGILKGSPASHHALVQNRRTRNHGGEAAT